MIEMVKNVEEAKSYGQSICNRISICVKKFARTIQQVGHMNRSCRPASEDDESMRMDW